MVFGSFGVTPAALRALARRPDLWPAAAVTGWRMVPSGWWRRWPPRPAPDPACLRFRAQTMFGGQGDTELGPAELVAFVAWCRASKARRWGRRRG